MVQYRRAWAEIDLAAVAHNAALLRAVVAPAALCAVVKADGYSHGAVAIAEAAVAGGASVLAVALVEEGLALRAAGITAPVLLLSEPPPAAIAAAVAAGLTPTLYSTTGLRAAAAAAGAAGRVVPVQVKVDTGMHRVGVAPSELVALAKELAREPDLLLEGLWTHFAVADDPADPFTALQLARFEEARADLAAVGIQPRLLHAANSAGALAHPASRFDLVRCGIALYGYPPSEALAPLVGEASGGGALAPVLSLRAEVHAVRRLAAGERPSYGRRYALPADTVVATVPLGYADGVPRAYFDGGGEVLIGGRRRRLAGTVTMDQLLVDVGDDRGVHPGDEVVLIGRQGDEVIDAAEWACKLHTIAYEVLLGIGPRVPRRPVGVAGAPVYALPVHRDGHGRAPGADEYDD
ncbi:MAG TPA: alanine racemase [Acidimicrobiales bacterium]|nr:alanine racemase [Acidimicrobiales bacterium]